MNLNNQTVQDAIQDCLSELEQLSVLLDAVEHTSKMGKYLTRYALIKACGTIEYSYKTLVADALGKMSEQLETYIEKKVRDSSSNPTYNQMTSLLNDFDSKWNSEFKNAVNSMPHHERITSSLDSLNKNRNNFAHGKNPTASFTEIRNYFNDAIKIIAAMDSILK